MLSKGAKKAFVVDDQESYSTGLADKVQQVLKSKGVAVERESVDQKATDFSALVSKISDDTDAVFLPWQIAANAQLFADQMREQGKKATIYGSDGLFAISDFHPEGAYVSSFAPDIKSIPADRALVAAYTKQYGSFGTFGPPSYLATWVMLTAMKKACATAHPSRLAVLRALPSVKVPNSPLGGTFSFSKTHDPAGAKFYLFQVKGGQFKGVG
jgi:branched-chain amino acid transport system substrate-binding protein